MEPSADDVLAADLLRGHTDTIVLGLLRRTDSYGFEIFKRIRDRTGAATRSRKPPCTPATAGSPGTG